MLLLQEHIYQWNRIGCLEIDSSMDESLVFQKGDLSNHWDMIDILINGVDTTSIICIIDKIGPILWYI